MKLGYLLDKRARYTYIGPMTRRHTDTIEEWIGVGEAARILGVGVDTIRRWESQGLMSSRRTPGNQRRFNRADIEALLGRAA